MRVPLQKRLRHRKHRDIAALQDLVVEAVYSLEQSAVLHGGTAVWRCFQGNRFSSDLDFYLKPKKPFKDSLEKKLSFFGAGLARFRQTPNSIYSRVERERVVVSLEIALRSFPKPVASSFEKSDGTMIDVFTLPVNDLLVEKLKAYNGRRLIRDIYDVYYLSGFVEASPAYSKKVAGLLEKSPEPVDEQNLKNMVLVGAIPSFAQMLAALNRRFPK